ncbi:hypothetical protein BaRGS_00008927 [Batillaria attramentaria]|uniref:Uncharacterized protein n=1 Tax=Batillaria attramentaria TaxID=370345 RepID=A0ABD0LKP8_9CAEN
MREGGGNFLLNEEISRRQREDKFSIISCQHTRQQVTHYLIRGQNIISPFSNSDTVVALGSISLQAETQSSEYKFSLDWTMVKPSDRAVWRKSLILCTCRTPD